MPVRVRDTRADYLLHAAGRPYPERNGKQGPRLLLGRVVPALRGGGLLGAGPRDKTLSDDEWAQIAGAVMNRNTGLSAPAAGGHGRRPGHRVPARHRGHE